jgi:hypothetical protein
MTTYYKVLAENGAAHHGGNGRWNLPKNGNPGRWKTVKGDLVPCRNGLHVCTREQLVHWLGPAIYEVEVDPAEILDAGDKTVVRRARLLRRLDTWDERTARLFAADCAERALRTVAKSTGKRSDPRSRAAVRAAREYANGNISAAELSAARDAAGDAAWAAAGDAAWAAAGDAAGDAAWAAAGDAARAAAGDAARAAAWAAAGDAAWDAAGDAAWAAERAWQTKRLFEILDGKRYAR